MNDSLSNFLQVGEQAARAGGAVLQSWLGKFQTREKAPADLVTDADLASQQAIHQLLTTAFPDHGFLGEEQQGVDRPGEYRWIVDPLDGTTNYVHQLPNYCVSIALEHLGQAIVAVVFDPTWNECYTAIRGRGAHLNGRALQASNIRQLSAALVACSFPAQVQPGAPEIAVFLEVLYRAQAIRRMGSAALNLCHLAAGRFDGYWTGDTKTWDVAAGALIVTEAGGVLTCLDGTPFDHAVPRFLAASTPELHAEMLALVRI